MNIGATLWLFHVVLMLTGLVLFAHPARPEGEEPQTLLQVLSGSAACYLAAIAVLVVAAFSLGTGLRLLWRDSSSLPWEAPASLALGFSKETREKGRAASLAMYACGGFSLPPFAALVALTVLGDNPNVALLTLLLVIGLPVSIVFWVVASSALAWGSRSLSKFMEGLGTLMGYRSPGGPTGVCVYALLNLVGCAVFAAVLLLVFLVPQSFAYSLGITLLFGVTMASCVAPITGLVCFSSLAAKGAAIMEATRVAKAEQVRPLAVDADTAARLREELSRVEFDLKAERDQLANLQEMRAQNWVTPERFQETWSEHTGRIVNLEMEKTAIEERMYGPPPPIVAPAKKVPHLSRFSRRKGGPGGPEPPSGPHPGSGG